MRWKDITLYQFQQIELINDRPITDLDKLLFSICVVFNMTEYELDNGGVRNFTRLSKKITKAFNEKFPEKPVNRIGKYLIEFDPMKLRFGQYVELNLFLQRPIIQSAHYVLASISRPFWSKRNRSEGHKKRADYFLTAPVTETIPTVKRFIDAFTEFNNARKKSFGLDNEVHTEETARDRFMVRYGWEYSATQVAERERITLNEAYDLPVNQALSALSYLKELDSFMVRQSNKK